MLQDDIFCLAFRHPFVDSPTNTKGKDAKD